MAAKKQDTSLVYRSICDDIRQGRIAPVYLLHGEEAYFIDKLTDLLLENVLTEEEKDFNLIQFYGADVSNVGDVVAACRRYPMMAEKQLVLFREMQAFDNRHQKLNDLSLYLEHPLESTVLILIFKTKTAGEKIVKAVESCSGVVFESARIPDYDNVLQNTVKPYILEKGLTIDPQALDLLCSCIGADLSRMFHEIDKLQITLKGTNITAKDVAEHIGISKDFNNYELITAIAKKDFRKVEMIRQYFAANPKANPIQVTLSVLFGFFTNLMLAHYCADKSLKGLMSQLRINYPTARDLSLALKNYNAWKTMYTITLIRDYDAKCKGARNVTLPDAEALKEFLYILMH